MLHLSFYTRRATSPMAAAVALTMGITVGACGGDDTHKKDLTAFVGAWTITNSSLTAACPPLAFPLTDAILPGEKLSFTAGTDSDLLIERDGCKVKFDGETRNQNQKPTFPA